MSTIAYINKNLLKVLTGGVSLEKLLFKGPAAFCKNWDAKVAIF